MNTEVTGKPEVLARPADGREQVVVLGGGFGGLEFCKRLHDPARYHLTLIDRQNHHCFQPLLYQVASAGLGAPEIAQPLRSILTGRTDLDVIMDEVKSVDLNARTVTTSERVVPYDHLVIGLGVRSSYFGHPEWARYAPGLKSLDEATALRRRVLTAFEKAEGESDPAKVKKLLTIAVIGGGPTGVELAGAFAELARTVVRKDFRRIDTTQTDVVLIEAAPRLLTMYPESISEYTRRRLEKLGVRVLTGEMVQEVGPSLVATKNHRIEADTIIWAAGMEAPPLTRTLGVELDRAGRIKVGPDLSVPGYPNVFAIGDIASVTGKDGKPVPGLCPAAIQMGEHVAKLLNDQPGVPPANRAPFKYFDKGSMATIGRSAAVVSVGGLSFTGFIAWLMWLFVHLLFLIGFRNKLLVFMQWIYSYLTYKRGARIITGRDPVE